MVNCALGSMAVVDRITYSKIVGTLPWTFGPIRVRGVRGTPSSSIITAHGVFDLNNIRSVRYRSSQHSHSLLSNCADAEEHTLNLPKSGYSMAAGNVSYISNPALLETTSLLLTPAKTRVISKTRIPFRGSVSSETAEE